MTETTTQAEALRGVMTRLSLTNRAVAAMFGVAEATVSRWVNDHQPIPRSVSVAVILLEALSKGEEERARRLVSFIITGSKE